MLGNRFVVLAYSSFKRGDSSDFPGELSQLLRLLSCRFVQRLQQLLQARNFQRVLSPLLVQP